MLLALNPKIEEVLRFPDHGTVIDGIATSAAIDTSGEMVDINGMDISSFNDGTGCLNSEHINPDHKQFVESPKDQDGQWGTIVGRIFLGKKIFAEHDCESERELWFWSQIKLPFVYIAGELFDNDGHKNAEALASIIHHYHERNLPILCRFSVEGSTVNRDGNVLKETIARKCAVTIKPCNHSAISGLVAEKGAPEEVVQKNEKYFSAFEMEYNPLILDTNDLMIKAINELLDLKKTLTLGSSNAAPGNLVGGAALGKEDVDKRMFVKRQVLAAFRDWDRVQPFEKFLKNRLPDANEEFIAKFSDIVDKSQIMKSESLNKANQTDELNSNTYLKPLSDKPKAGAKKFKGKYVNPGEVELLAGPYQGSKLKLLHLDDNYAYVQPFKSGGEKEVKVNKLNRNIEGAHFKVSKKPEALDVPNQIDANKHTDLNLTNSHEQKELVHGIDLSKEPIAKPYASTEARSKGDMAYGWYRSAHGKLAHVKPSIVYEQEDLNPKDKNYLSTSRREVIFHNIAKKYFGLGEHVPTTTLFKHPDTGLEHSAMEVVPEATHIQSKSPAHEGRDILVKEGDSGNLDKLAVMDYVMGNSDRKRFNYMVSPKTNKTHLIDNALTFNFGDKHIPQYLTDYHNFKGQDIDKTQMHPDTVQWLRSLDPFELGAELTAQGVSQDLATESVSRLMSMQSHAILGNTKKQDILFAHSRFKEGI